MATARFRVRLLGELELEGPEGSARRFRTHKTAALLGFLAFYRHRSHSRESLMEMLWPEEDGPAVRHRLNVALSALRKQLEPGNVPFGSVLHAEKSTIQLNPSAVTTDAGDFERLVTEGQHASSSGALRSAVVLFAGQLMPGHYEEWIVVEQRRLEALYFEAVRELVPILVQEGELTGALDCALRAQSLDPFREESVRLVMRLYHAAGQPRDALRSFQAFRTHLKKEMGLEPSRGTLELAQRLEVEDISTVATAEAATPLPPRPARVVDNDPEGGAVPLGSRFYVARTSDKVVGECVRRGESIVLVKGPRQVGKTSLLARALNEARSSGASTVFTDVSLFNQDDLADSHRFLQAVARDLVEQLGSSLQMGAIWNDEDGPNINVGRLVRRLLQEDDQGPLVWAWDDVDRLFGVPFGLDVFALMRHWHNDRAMDPGGPWGRLTLVVGYATEAHLFIPDHNLSPFNVGVRVEMADFSELQLRELNQRYGSPLRTDTELAGFRQLVGGHPYLVRRGLKELGAGRIRLSGLLDAPEREANPYEGHLRQLSLAVRRDPELSETLRQTLEGHVYPDAGAFYRLRSAGILIGETHKHARARCDLYARFFRRYLTAPTRPDD